MIKNYEEKKFAEKQIAKIEKILISLKKQLLPKREEQFKAMATVYIRMIREIREEIEEYTGMELLNIKKNDINIHIEGPVIEYGSAPISLISSYLENFKRTIQNYYMIINKIKGKRVSKFISELTDFSLNAFQPGSVNLAISIPIWQISFLENKNIEETLNIYFNILKWTCYNDESYISDINQEIKEKLLINTLRTLPDNKKIDKITFSGKLIAQGDKITLNYNTRKKIKQEIDNVNGKNEIISIKGCIRGLDLDKLLFVLRDCDKEISGDIKCKLTKDIVDDMKEYLDSKVLIRGIKNNSGIIQVKYIEILD